MSVRNLQSVLHKELSGERLAFVWKRLVVNPVEFVHGIDLVRIETGHLHARKLVVV